MSADMTGSSNGSPSSSSSCKKRTIGEELWEVHLHRDEGDRKNSAIDHAMRSPTRTIGEELWQVHLQRSQGVQPDYDQDDQDSNQNLIQDSPNSEKAENPQENVIGLRNRAVSIQSH